MAQDEALMVKKSYKPSKFRVGWYGLPGGPESASTLTHIVEVIPGGVYPVCGASLGLRQEFQHCAMGFRILMPECKRCQRWRARVLGEMGHDPGQVLHGAADPSKKALRIAKGVLASMRVYHQEYGEFPQIVDVAGQVDAMLKEKR